MSAPLNHNGGPSLEGMTLKRKLECARAILDRSDLTSTQKCVGLWMVVQADKEWTTEARTAELLRAASAKDRETVFKATRELDAKGIIAKSSVRGQGGKYTVVPPRVVEAITQAYEEKKSSRVKADHLKQKQSGETGRVGPGEVVGLNGTGQVKPVGFDPTTPKQSGETGRVSPDHSSRAEVSNNIYNNNLTQHNTEQEAARVAALDLGKLSERLITASAGCLDNPANCQGLLNMGVPMMWLDNGCDLDRDILPTLTAAGTALRGKRIRSWSFFTPAIQEQRDRRIAGMPAASVSTRVSAKPDAIDLILAAGRPKFGGGA